MQTGHRIDYKQLRKINPEAARLVVLEYLRGNGGNIAEAARTFGINRPVVYDILRKQSERNLSLQDPVGKRSAKGSPAPAEENTAGY